MVNLRIGKELRKGGRKKGFFSENFGGVGRERKRDLRDLHGIGRVFNFRIFDRESATVKF